MAQPFRDAWERLLPFNKDKKIHMYQDAVMVPMSDWKKSRFKNLNTSIPNAAKQAA